MLNKIKKERAEMASKMNDEISNNVATEIQNADIRKDGKAIMCFSVYIIKRAFDKIIEINKREIDTYKKSLKSDNDLKIASDNINKGIEPFFNTLKSQVTSLFEDFSKLPEEYRNAAADAVNYFKLDNIILIKGKAINWDANEFTKTIREAAWGSADDDVVITHNSVKPENEESSNDSSSNSSEESSEDNKETVKDAIADNKDLLTPIAKAANVSGEQLLSIITKLCKTGKDKARKLDEGVITGLSIMICGALLAVKKNGKTDKKAIASIVDKINKVVLNSKRGIRDILK